MQSTIIKKGKKFCCPQGQNHIFNHPGTSATNETPGNTCSAVTSMILEIESKVTIQMHTQNQCPRKQDYRYYRKKKKQFVRQLPQLKTVTENYHEKLSHTFSATMQTVNKKHDEIPDKHIILFPKVTILKITLYVGINLSKQTSYMMEQHN